MLNKQLKTLLGRIFLSTIIFFVGLLNLNLYAITEQLDTLILKKTKGTKAYQRWIYYTNIPDTISSSEGVLDVRSTGKRRIKSVKINKNRFSFIPIGDTEVKVDFFTSSDTLSKQIQIRPEIIELTTTHLEHYYLQQESVRCLAKIVNTSFPELNLKYQLKDQHENSLLTDQIVFDIDSRVLKKTVFKKKLSLGKYIVDYQYYFQDSLVSENSFIISVIPDTIPPKDKQLARLKNKYIFIPVGGWAKEKICDAAKEFGYNVINAPAGKIPKGDQTSYYISQGMDVVIRPGITVEDPFDSQDIDDGIEELKPLVDYYASHPSIKAIAIAWGLFGEGGFPVPPLGTYKFSDKALESFNEYLNTGQDVFDQDKTKNKLNNNLYCEKIPTIQNPEKPQSMKYIKWLEFRQKALKSFRKKYVKEIQKATDKLVGTWSEIYPVVNYQLNMGDAPCADFMWYDLSFGDVTFNQKIAFGETHGDMQDFDKFESYRDNILPLMAKAYGEGVTPVAFQFPMRRGRAIDFLRKTVNFIDELEEHYALRLQPYIEEMMEAEVKFQTPEVALAYPSYAAAAFPQSLLKLNLYMQNSREIEAFLHMMGVSFEVLPWENLESSKLDKYKLVILPDAMYLNQQMYENIKNSQTNILVTGDFLRAYWDGKKYIQATEWNQSKSFPKFTLEYVSGQSGKIEMKKQSSLTEGLQKFNNIKYPQDRYVQYKNKDTKIKTLITAGPNPILVEFTQDKLLHIPNRLFGMARLSSQKELETFAFNLFKNILKYSDVKINIVNDIEARAKNYVYGPYGSSNNILWNQTEQALTLKLKSGETIQVPANNWRAIY